MLGSIYEQNSTRHNTVFCCGVLVKVQMLHTVALSAGLFVFLPAGIQTGSCVISDVSKKTCEVSAWCPIEKRGNPPRWALFCCQIGALCNISLGNLAFCNPGILTYHHLWSWREAFSKQLLIYTFSSYRARWSFIWRSCVNVTPIFSLFSLNIWNILLFSC